MKTRSIKYKGKVYTLKDIPKSFLKKYDNGNTDVLKQYIASKIRCSENYVKNKEARNKANRENYYANKEHYAKINKERYDKKRDEILAYKKEYYYSNRDILLKKSAEYRAITENSKRAIEISRQWRKDNPNYKPVNQEANKARYRSSKKGKIDILRDRLRCQLRSALVKYSKEGKVMTSIKYNVNYASIINKLSKDAKIIGYTLIECIKIGFHIDHKIPVSAYDLNDKDDIRNCFNPENLQWLDAVENLSKGNKLILELIKTLPKEIYPVSWNGKIPKET